MPSQNVNDEYAGYEKQLSKVDSVLGMSFADENINETSRGGTTPKITINATNN